MPLEINLGQPALAPVNVDRVTLRNALSSEIAGASQVNRGWQSAGIGEDANALMWKANEAAISGDHQTAAVLKQQGTDLMRQAQQWAPTVRDMTDINGVGSAVDWAGGALGNIRSSVAPALGGLAGAAIGGVGGAVIGGVPGMAAGANWGSRIGAGLAGYNTMTEGNAADMMMDSGITSTPQEIANAARSAGVVQGALEAVVPAGVAGSVVGLGGRKAAAEIAKNGLLKTAGKRVGIDAAEEFATEFAQNPVGDVAKNYLKGEDLGNVDWEAALNAGAAGAVGGAGMGAMGAGADALHAQLGKGIDKAVEIKNDPLGAVLDAGVDLAAKAGTAKAKLENYFDERELKKAGLTQDEIDQGRLEQIQATLAGKSDLKSTSPISDEENLMDAPSFNAHHESKLKEDAATILKAGRDSTGAEKDIASKFASGNMDAVEFQTRLHQVQQEKAAAKQTDDLLTGLGQKSKKSEMRTSDRMYMESELLKPEAQQQKVNTLADIMVKQGIDEKIVHATNGEHNKVQLAGMLNWISDGMNDTPEAVKAIVTRFGQGSSAIFKKAYHLAKNNGLIKPHDDFAEEVVSRLDFASDSQAKIHKALRTNLSDIALHGVTDVDGVVAKLAPMMKTVVQEGMSPKVKQGLIDNFFGTEERLHNVMNAFIDTGEHKKKVSKATGGGKEEVEIDADGNVVAPEQTDEDGELIVDKFGAGASVSEVKGPTIVGFTNPKGRVGIPFNLGFDKGIEKFEKVKAQHSSEMGNSVTEAGIWSRTKADLGNDEKAIDQAGYDLLESFGPKLMPEGKYASLIKGFSEGAIDIGDLSPRQRAVLLGRINRQFKYLEVSRPDSGDSKHNIQDVDSFKWNPNDAKPETFTAQKGIIFLEREGSKGVSNFPVKTIALFKQGLLTETEGTDGATLEGKRRGALGTSDLVMSGLTDLMLAEGGNFTGRIGYRLEEGAPLQWIEKAERGGNVKLERLPNELMLGQHHTVADAKAQADIERREEKSTDAGINFAENHKERVKALLELAQRESTSDKFAYMIHATMKKGAPAILQLYRKLRDQWQGSPDGFGGTPVLADKDAQTEMRRNSQKEGVPAPSAAQGRIEAEDGNVEEVHRGTDGARVGYGADAMGAGYEGPASTRSRTGTKADPARKVKREGGDQIAARDWVVGLLQKGVPAFNAAMRKVGNDQVTTARVEAGFNALMGMSEQGVAEHILGDKTKLKEAATIIAQAIEVRGDKYVVRNAGGKTEVRGRSDAVTGLGAKEVHATSDQHGASAGPDVGTGAQGGTSGEQGGQVSAQGRNSHSDGHPSGSTGLVVQKRADAVSKTIRGGTGVHTSSSQSGSHRDSGTRAEFISDFNDAYGTSHKEELEGTDKGAGRSGLAMYAGSPVRGETGPTNGRGNTEGNTGGIKQSAQQPKNQAKGNLHEQVAASEAHILKTVGAKVEVLFERMTNGSGSWTEGQTVNTIKLALNGDVLGAAFHESFHEFVDILKKNGSSAAVEVMQRAAMNPIIQRKLERLLDGHPEAIKQLADPEEAAAFMYQFWMAGALKVGPETRTTFQKIKDMLKRVAGMFSESFRNEVEGMTREQLEAGHAELLMRQFSEGAVANIDTRQAVVDGINKDAELHNASVERVGETFQTFANTAGKMVFSAEAMMDATGNKHMIEIMRDMHQKVGTAMRKVGKSTGSYSDGLRQATSQWVHKVESILEGYSEEDLELAREAMSKEVEPTDRVAKEIVAKINKFYADMAGYMAEKGVKRLNMDRIDPATGMKGVWEDIPLRKNYLSQVWSIDTLMSKMPEFKADLLKHHMKELEAIAADANKELKDLKGITSGTASGIELARAEQEFKDSGKVMAKLNLQTITPEMVADALGMRLLASNGHIEISESNSGLGITPAASAVNKRELNWLDKEVFDKYKEKNLTSILTTYAHSIVKRGEYQSRFGPAGEKIADGADKAVLHELGGDDLVDLAEKVLPSHRNAWKKKKAKAGEDFDEPFPTLRSVGQKLNVARVGQEKHDAALLKTMKKLENGFNAIQALEGTLGRDLSPNARALNSWLVTYQSFRTLSTMLFTSFQDVAGIVVNGGEAKDAWNAFVEGIREIRNTVFDHKNPSAAVGDAEFWGTVDSGAYLESTAQAQGSPFMSGKAKVWSDKFFKYTGAVGWNRGVRAVATQVAERIITGWKTNGIDRNDKAAVARLEDLYGKDFDPANIKLDADGRLAKDDPANQAAITRWVLTAVPAPTAAHRTIWMSDPHWAVFAQLKNYTYSFHRIMMKNAADQARLGNYRPALAMMAGYIPIAIAAGAVKEMLIPGEEPPWMKGGLDGYLNYGFSRAGVLGVPQMMLGSLVDASQLPGGNFGKAGSSFDPAGLAGPTVDQVQNILSIPFGEFMAMKDHTVIGEGLGALPGGNMLKRLERLGSV